MPPVQESPSDFVFDYNSSHSEKYGKSVKELMISVDFLEKSTDIIIHIYTQSTSVILKA